MSGYRRPRRLFYCYGELKGFSLYLKGFELNSLVYVFWGDVCKNAVNSYLRSSWRGWVKMVIIDAYQSYFQGISSQGQMHPKKKVAESNAAQMMLDSDDFKEYIKHIDS